MENNYAGIDYSNGKSNIDRNTGIHYGVIPMHEVVQAWADESEPYYPFVCPHCGEDLPGGSLDDMIRALPEDEENPSCPICEHVLEEDDFEYMDPTSFLYSRDGYEAEQGFDDTDIFIMKSPYFTYAQFCSPCAPGAGYILNTVSKQHSASKTYCFGHDWFDKGKAPYPVYDVNTGELTSSEN
jgi:hypothetical protein